jgi:hypothetical protein
MTYKILLSDLRFCYKIFSISLFLIFFTSCEAQAPVKKINGLSLVASREEITNDNFQAILHANANAVAVMPFGFMESLESPELRFNVDRQWWGERVEGAGKTIQLAKQNGLSVMLKPQIWIRRGDFTGHLKMNSEEDWKKFGENYKEFILLYAALAEKEKAEILCIGTELNSFVEARPQFWIELIAEVKKVYKGQLTYAENWDKIENVHFWNNLDYIGVDAYFPLNEAASPNLEEIRTGWRPVKKQLKKLSQKNKKPILFTEYGYRNVDHSLRMPWDASRELTGNDENQAKALKGLYEEVWNEKWFAGGFLWKWFQDHLRAGGAQDNQFTPQNKPAEAVVKEYYGKFGS